MLKTFKLLSSFSILSVITLSTNMGSVHAMAQTKAIAHRGLHNDSIQENTLAALEGAYKANAYVETDVFLTKDNKIVIQHDKSLDRMTNCSGDINTWLLSDLRDQCKTNQTNLPVATFNEFASTLELNRNQLMNVEVKGSGWYENNNANIKQLRNIALKNNVLDRIYFSEDATIKVLEAFRDSAPDALTAWKPNPTDDVTITRAQELSVNAVMAIPSQWESKNMVTRFENNGFKTWARLNDNDATWKRMNEFGVDGQLTDRPRAFNKFSSSFDQ